MLRKANNVYSVLLDDVTKLRTSLPAGGTVITDANLPAGAIVMCDMGMRRLVSGTTPGTNAYAFLSATDKFFIVQGKGTGVPLMKSPAITKGSMTINANKFKAAAQQVTYVGYSTKDSTGALSSSLNTRYWVKIRKRDNDAANRSQPMSLFAGPINSGASATQASIAMALVKNGTKNFAQEPANGYLKFEATCAGAQVAFTGVATAILVTNGSKNVTFSNGSGVAAAGQALTAGTYVNIAGTMYEVASLGTTAGFTMTTPYTGATAEVLEGTTAATQAGVVATPGNCGIRITGVEAPFNVNTFRDYYANRFTVTFSDTTVPVKSDGANDGAGVWQKVAMNEYMSYGFEGANNQLAVPSIARDQVVKIPGVAGYTALDCKYGAINISWEETINGLVSRDGGKGSVLIYLNLLNSSGTGVLPSTTTAANESTGYELAVNILGFTAANIQE
jgi:hypothetical protein